MPGPGLCSSGNQSGGFSRSSICCGVYCLVLPGTVFGPGASAGSVPACTGKAHEGSRPAGEGSDVDCTPCCCDSSPADTAITSAPTTAQLRPFITWSSGAECNSPSSPSSRQREAEDEVAAPAAPFAAARSDGHELLAVDHVDRG